MSILEFIAQLRGREAHSELVFVDGSQVQLALRNAQVTHAGLRVGLPRIDERLQIESSGSVGLTNQELDLQINVPVPIEQIAQQDTVRELGVPVVHVAIGGTLEAPVIDWEAMRGESAILLGQIRSKLAADSPGAAALMGALEGWAEGNGDQAIAAASDFIRELQERRRSARANSGTESDPSSTESQPKRRLGDALRGILRGK